MVASGFGTFAVAIVVSVVVAIALLFVLFRAMWRVAEPNEALIISGFRQHGPPSGASVGESMGFKIVTGHGTFVIPGVQVVRKLSLDLNEAELVVDCVTPFTKSATISFRSPTPRVAFSINKIRWTRESRTSSRGISARSAAA